MPSFFRPNPNLANELEKQPEYSSGLAQATEPAKNLAQQFAPVDEGDYRDSIKVVEQGGKVFLSAFDYKAVWMEYGTGAPDPTPIFAPLRRGAMAAGLRFVEGRK